MIYRLAPLLSLAAVPLLGAAAFAAPTPLTRAVAQESEFGAPLVVGGKHISDTEIKRFLVYGPGKNALEARKLQALMNHEIALRRSSERELVIEENPAPDTSGLDDAATAEAMAVWNNAVDATVEERMKRYFADPAAVEARLAKEKADFQEKYPTLDHEVELCRAYTSGDWYREQVHQTMNFDALFFPDHPDTWPDLSVEAIHAGSPEVDLIADYAREYERRLQVSIDTGEPIVPEQEMMMALLRDFVMGALWSLADIQTATDGIPAELAMVIDGGDWRVEIPTQDVFEEMGPYFSGQDVEDAKLFLALMTAAEQKMAADGILMSDEDFGTMMDELAASMQNTMFSMEFLALQGHGFPSQVAYNRHLRLVESMRRSTEDKLQLDELGNPGPEMASHLETANSIMGLARAEVEVLMVSAFDFDNFRWKDDGWQGARDRALALRQEVDAYLVQLAQDDGASGLLPFDQWWRQFLDLNSDYWDPPLPQVGKPPPAIGLKNRGRFQDEPMTRNDMKRAIGESEFSHFLGNDAVVDKAFFDLQPGQIGGPFRGPKGYYLIYLESRTAPTNPLRLSNERHLRMLQEDYIRKAFQKYAHEALANAEVSGL